MPSDALPSDSTTVPSANHAAEPSATVVQLPPPAGGIQPVPTSSVIDDCPLKVGGKDPRGNTVKYIYACDGDYVVYYSRLEHAPDPDDVGPYAPRHVTRRLLRLGRRSLLPALDAAYESEGVQAQLSADPALRQQQRRLLLPLGAERARLQALLIGWRRRQSYDTRIATALQLALGGDPDGTANQSALEALTDAKTAILAERDTAGRAQYVKYTLICAVLGTLLIGTLPDTLFRGDQMIWLGGQAGVVGAFLSIAISIRRRTVALNIDRAANLTDCALRLLIGAVSGGTLVLLFGTGLLPTLHTGAGELQVNASPTASQFTVLLGLIAGFVEQLVPSMLEKQADRFTSGDPPKPPSATPDAAAMQT
jgi:hypothetical protein